MSKEQDEIKSIKMKVMSDFYLPLFTKLLNINELRMKKIKKGFMIPPSGVL